MKDDTVVGITREKDLLDERPLALTSEVFETWMEQSTCQRAAGDHAFTIGSRLLAILTAADDDDKADLWRAFRSLAAVVTGNAIMRLGTSVLPHIIAVVLRAHNAIELDVPSSVAAGLTHQRT